MRVVRAAAVYFLLVFSAGFVLGTVRVLALVPWLGEAAATLVEAPLLIAAMIATLFWMRRHHLLPDDTPGLVWMGLAAALLVLIADFGVGSLLRGQSVTEQLARFATSAGQIYLAMLVVFAGLPAVVGRTPHAR